MNERPLKGCDECGSLFFAETSRMDALCPECAQVLYGHEPCVHAFVGGRCSKCYWDGSVSEYCKTLKETADLDPPELVTGAIREQLSFKVVAAKLKKHPPNQAAAEIVADAYR